MELKSLDQVFELAKKKGTRRIAVAASADKAVLKAVKQATMMGIVEPLLIGDKQKTEMICSEIDFNISSYTLIDEKDPALASAMAVQMIKEGMADILMKGMVSTAPLLKAVLHKEYGLRKQDTLSHFALFQTSYYHKLIGITDAAMNIAPELAEKVSIIQNSIEVFHALGHSKPKLAVIGPLETVNEKISSTTDAALLTQMNRRNQIKGCIIDGPLAIDNAVSKEAAEHKGIVSEVAGDADILLAPDLNSGNILYKTMIFLSDGLSAAIITGATVPIVLTSRADSEKSKLYSIALAAAM
jgi:phosphate butyryltransferase